MQNPWLVRPLALLPIAGLSVAQPAALRAQQIEESPLNVDPMADTLRSNPRFQAPFRKIWITQ